MSQSPPINLQSAVSPAGQHPDADYNILLGLVRDIRAETQNLQNTLQEIKKKGEIADAQLREREIKAALQNSADIFGYNSSQIGTRHGELRALLARNPEIYARHGDDVTYIENFWERATHSYPQAGMTVDEILLRADETGKLLGKLICRSGLITIPERVNKHMEQLRVGRTLDFHDTFKDELSEADDRLLVLRYMHSHPRAVAGVVDVEQGVIYSVSPKGWRRVFSFLPVVLLPVLGAILFKYIDDADFVTDPGAAYNLAGYAALIAGGYVHVIVDALKQARAEKGQSLVAVEDWLLWIHVKELSIIVGILSLFVGYAGLSFFLKKPAEVSTAFFIGYSIDSFVDLFLGRFTKTVSAGAAAVKV